MVTSPTVTETISEGSRNWVKVWELETLVVPLAFSLEVAPPRVTSSVVPSANVTVMGSPKIFSNSAETCGDSSPPSQPWRSAW